MSIEDFINNSVNPRQTRRELEDPPARRSDVFKILGMVMNPVLEDVDRKFKEIAELLVKIAEDMVGDEVSELRDRLDLIEGKE